MLNAVSLMLLTGVIWMLVGVLFGAAPSEKDKLLPFRAERRLPCRFRVVFGANVGV